ncbi:MAG TPA: endonuclease III [Candidatus Pacearchaeota archaeon]|nr:endonuclease III [Candidatus Pacearchaeota archaeon]
MQKELKQLKELRRQGKGMRLAVESWKSDYQILIATILSARTRDEKTIPVAGELFKRYYTAEKLSMAKLSDVQKIIRPINFYRNKSKNIINCAKVLVKTYDGKVPHNFEKLVLLPGVGRKTANVFLSEVGYSEIGVDTHVAYISRKIGWTSHQTQEKIEQDLKNLFPEKYWGNVNSNLVRFGKTFTSRKKKDEILERIKRIK